MKDKIPFSELKLHPPYRVMRRAKDGVVGLDSESLVSGYAFLITDSLGNCRWIHSEQDVLDFLTNPLYRKSFNTFWNMDFDVSVLLKWFGYGFCRDLVKNHKATFEDVHFEYVPKRFLIVRKGKIWNTFFDASQYYVPRALNSAAKQYLGKAKKSMSRKEFYDSDYDSEAILDYCKYDSTLCAELTQLLLCDLHDMGFSPSTLASPGTIMEEALIGAVYLPDVTKIPREALEYAYNAYMGGWMECFKRGYFPKLWDYDISSAYPYQVSKLVDLNGGEWIYTKGDIPHGAVYGFVHCEVDIRGRVSPIIYQADINVTPRGEWRRYLTLNEFKWVGKKAKMLSGWFFIPSPVAGEPFYPSMVGLWKQKRRIRNRWLPKSLSVSIYGKFAQRYENGETGNLFNPVYASTITANTRLEIAEYASMLPECLCVVSTDGLTFHAPLPGAVLADKFGGLRLSHCSEGVIVGTNVYTLAGKAASGNWRPGRFDWLKLLREHPDDVIFPLEHFRPTTLSEGIVSPEQFEKVGVFETFKYDFDLNFDHKRLFKKVSCARDLLENVYESEPWEVGIVKRRKELLWEMK